MDGRDISEYHAKVSGALIETVQAARVTERMIWDALMPKLQAAAEKVMKRLQSKHRGRWGDERDFRD